MKHYLWIIFIFIIGCELNAQGLSSDSLVNVINGGVLMEDTTASSSEDFINLQIHSVGSEEMYFIPNSPFSLKLDLQAARLSLYDETFFHRNLYLSYAQSGNLLNDNKNRMFSTFSSFYERSKPTKMQQVLGMVQFSGAAFLAGYHIYKYYIKKKD